jgi:hypothetical protein
MRTLGIPPSPSATGTISETGIGFDLLSVGLANANGTPKTKMSAVTRKSFDILDILLLLF